MMLSPRLGLLFALSVLAAACGGKIDDGTDSGVDSGADSPSPPPTCKPSKSQCSVSVECCSGSVCINGYCGTTPPTCTPDYAKCSTSSQCCSQLCEPNGYCAPNTPPPPPCEPYGAACSSSSQCCSQVCGGGICGGPPPPCKPDGSSCLSAGECCSSVCNANLCGAIFVDAGPIVDSGPIACASTSNKLCDQCVAQSCCPQMVSCGNDGLCSNWLSCVQSCEQKGYSALWCTQNACGAPSDAAETSLYSCAQQYCATPCAKD